MNIALFCYNRPEHTRKVLESLRGSKDYELSDCSLTVYVDGTSKDHSEVELVLNEYKDDYGTYKIHYAGKRMGLRAAVEAGLTDFFSYNECGTILEDDIVVAPYYLKYMWSNLIAHCYNRKVFSICSFVQPPLDGPPRTFAIPRTSSWGWSTWSDRWDKYDPNFKVPTIKKLAKQLDFGDVQFSRHFLDNPLWAIRWYYTQFKYHGVSIFPTRSMSINVGMDGTGTNRDFRNPRQELYMDKLEHIAPPFPLNLDLYGEYLSKNYL